MPQREKEAAVFLRQHVSFASKILGFAFFIEKNPESAMLTLSTRRRKQHAEGRTFV